MNTCAAFLLKQSFKIMLSGFAVAMAGIIVFIAKQNTPLEKTGFIVTFCGLCIWFFGRVCLVIERRRQKREAAEESGSET
jgi:uncharacterized membrane protein